MIAGARERSIRETLAAVQGLRALAFDHKVNRERIGHAGGCETLGRLLAAEGTPGKVRGCFVGGVVGGLCEVPSMARSLCAEPVAGIADALGESAIAMRWDAFLFSRLATFLRACRGGCCLVVCISRFGGRVDVEHLVT